MDPEFHDPENADLARRETRDALEERIEFRARELRESEEKFRSAMQYSPIGLGLVSLSGYWLEVNEALCRIVGYTAGELANLTYHDITHPDDQGTEQKLVAQLMDGDIPSYQTQKRYIRKDGHFVWIQLNASLVRDDNGAPRYFISQIQDITERKQAEEAMRAVSTDLVACEGVEYFQSAAMHLARITGADFALVTECDTAPPETVRTIAFVQDGALAPNTQYPLAGTPCADVFSGNEYAASDDIQVLFPKDRFLAENSLRAYAAAPLRDAGGRILGHVVVMKRNPFVNIEVVAQTLRTFALAVVAQMVREKNQRRYQDLFEFAPDALLMTDRSGTIVMANRQAENLFGWPRSELIGQLVENLVPEGIRGNHASLREAYLESAEPRPMGTPGPGLTAVRRDGTTFPIDISLGPMDLESGTMVAVSVRDVSERQENRRALDLRNMAIEATGLGVTITSGVDDDCRILDANRAFEKITGYAKPEVLGRNPRFLGNRESSSEGYDTLRAAIAEGRPARVLLRNFRKSGEPFWNELSIAPVLDADARPVNFVGIVNDVTDRVEAEGRTRTMADALPVLLAYFDADDRCRMVNRTFEAWFERPARDIIGKRREELLTPESYADYVSRIEAAGGFDHEVVYQGKRTYPDGKARQVEVHHVPQRDTTGQVAGYYTMILDITERERTREMLSQSQRMESIGQLSGGIAHDFNNLLSVIQGNLQLLSRRIDSEPRTLGGKYIGSALDAVARGSDLTRRLLSFSRRQKLETSVFNVSEHLRETDKLLARAIGEHIELKTRLDDDIPDIEGDLSQFENAVLNLAVNARDAMPSGGTLTIETQLVTLDSDHEGFYPEMESGKYVMVAVVDTGKGMSEEIQQHAFEPFFSTKESGKGTGLGLASVFGYVKQSGGHVTLKSAVGIGTTVSLYFPVSSAPRSDKRTRNPWTAADNGGGSETILVVDDNPDILELNVEALKELGYEVLSACNAMEAIEILKRSPAVRLLFTDVVMPGPSGLELAEQARGLRPDLPVLFTSGYAEEATRANGFSNLAHSAWVHKPASLDEIAVKLRELLNGSD